MSDIEQKARDMVLEVLRESELPREPTPIAREYWKALCRAIEQHEATNTALRLTAGACADHVNTIIQLRSELADFRQEVSDALVWYFGSKEGCVSDALRDFIIPAPKPDALVEALKETYGASLVDADDLRAALEARGLEIRDKSK